MTWPQMRARGGGHRWDGTPLRARGRSLLRDRTPHASAHTGRGSGSREPSPRANRDMSLLVAPLCARKQTGSWGPERNARARTWRLRGSPFVDTTARSTPRPETPSRRNATTTGSGASFTAIERRGDDTTPRTSLVGSRPTAARVSTPSPSRRHKPVRGAGASPGRSPTGSRDRQIALFVIEKQGGNLVAALYAREHSARDLMTPPVCARAEGQGGTPEECCLDTARRRTCRLTAADGAEGDDPI